MSWNGRCINGHKELVLSASRGWQRIAKERKKGVWWIVRRIDWYDSWCEWCRPGTLCSVLKMTILRPCWESSSAFCYLQTNTQSFGACHHSCHVRCLQRVLLWFFIWPVYQLWLDLPLCTFSVGDSSTFSIVPLTLPRRRGSFFSSFFFNGVLTQHRGKSTDRAN